MLQHSVVPPSPAPGPGNASTFPAILTPPSPRAARAPGLWLRAHLSELRETLSSAGAILLRGFEIAGPDAFAELARAFGGPLGHAYRGPSPRESVSAGVYTASEVPSTLVIPEHAEMSYLPRMPRHLFLWCQTPARRGGATTLVDARKLLGALDPARIAPLLEGPLRVRRRHALRARRVDLFELKPWPELFNTHDREQALRAAQEHGFKAYFEASGALTLESQQRAVRAHPVTGERAFLNHLLVYHASAPAALLESAWRNERALGALAAYPLARGYRALSGWLARDVATDVRTESGAPIPDACLDHVRSVVEAEAYHVAWRAGDMAIVDNHSVLHGRRPFRGPRQVAVAWSAKSA